MIFINNYQIFMILIEAITDRSMDEDFKRHKKKE